MPKYFQSSNGHEVRHYGRGFFKVSSFSREGPEFEHTVDLEADETEPGRAPIFCDCESFIYHGYPCRHIRAVGEWGEAMIWPDGQPKESLTRSKKRQYRLDPSKKMAA